MDRDLEKNADLAADDAMPDNTSDQVVLAQNEKSVEADRETNAAAPKSVSPMDPSQFPEGGLEAWTVVFGAACGIYVSFGWINCEYHHLMYGVADVC